MRPIFQDFVEIVFSPYISIDGDAMKSRFSKFVCTLAIYRIAGKIRGVLIFVIFVVELVVTKFSTHKN